ncbi:MAG: ABC transporter ATP-binding protein [Actinomycetota bacterium]|nr:ABC transporter ATP-binding protein [Actinomycetota bacterium]
MAAGTETVLDVENLRVSSGARGERRVLVRGVSLTVGRRRTVALVGESGSGKTLTGLALMGLTPAGTAVAAERLLVGGVDLTRMSEPEFARVRGRRIAMVFQNPMEALNPVLRVGHQFSQVLTRNLGVSRSDARDRARELLDSVGVSDARRRLGQYPFEMSGGMLQRMMIALALAAEPDLLVADEPTTALDTTLQAQVMALLAERREDVGMGMVLVSHDLGLVAEYADEVNVMYAGRVVERAPTREMFASPVHPYTLALLRTVREIASPGTDRLSSIPGSPPPLDDPGSGCAFAPRCSFATAECTAVVPELKGVAEGHDVACVRSER